MNSVLSYIAALLVAVLVAALIAPSFVDWTQFRGGIEAQASQAMGRQVRIGGPIDLVLLPTPRFKLSDVTIANADDGKAAHLAEVDLLEGAVSLAPLLQGEIAINGVRAVGGRIFLERNGEGRANWEFLTGGEEGSAVLDPKSVSFDDALIESAVVHFESMQTGRSWKVEKVGGELTATSLLGPLRGLLAFELSGVPATLSFAVGDFGVGKAYPVSIDVKADGSTKVEASFSGIVTRTAGISRLDGSLSGRVGPAPSEDAAQPADPRRVEFSSAAVIGQNGAEFRTVQIKSAAGTISGAGRLGWRERLKLTGELTSSSFTVDRFNDIFGPSEEVLEALINSDFPLVDVIDLALSADAVILDRRAYRDVSVAHTFTSL